MNEAYYGQPNKERKEDKVDKFLQDTGEIVRYIAERGSDMADKAIEKYKEFSEEAGRRIEEEQESYYIEKKDKSGKVYLEKSKLNAFQRKQLSNMLGIIGVLGSASTDVDAIPQSNTYEDKQMVAESNYVTKEGDAIVAGGDGVIRIKLSDISSAKKESQNIIGSQIVESIEEPAFPPEFANEIKNKIAGLESGEMRSNIERLLKRAERPVSEKIKKARIDYLQENITFDDGVPGEVQNMFRSMIAGLCAQESAYRDNADSGQARGPLQFRPDTWTKDMGQNIRDIESFELQAMAFGRYMSEIYEDTLFQIRSEYDSDKKIFIDAEGGKEALRKLESILYPGELDRFRAYSSIVSYNTGKTRWGAVVREYLNSNPDLEEGITAEALFHEVLTYGLKGDKGLLSGFGDDGYNYVYKIISKSIMLNMARGDEREVRHIARTFRV